MAVPYDVVFLMPWAAPLLAGSGPTGGAETQIVALAKGLAARGLRVGIAVIGDRAAFPRRVGEVDVIVQAPPLGIRFLGGLLHDVRTFRALLRSPARVIVARVAGRNVAVAALAARLRRAAFVYSSASNWEFDPASVPRGVNLRVYELGLRSASEIVVQTEEQAEMCRARLGRDPVVIRSIAERAAPRRGVPEAFLWVGRMMPVKRLEIYLDLAADVPEARFQVIAVPVPGARPELLERARELPNVEVLEPRPRAAVGTLVDRAVAIVSTSEQEGMPNTFLEAWTRGVPALAFSHDPDGLVQRFGLGGFADGSRERFAELARSLWAARGDQREMAERCIAYVHAEHDLDVVCEAWQGVLARAGKH